MPTRAPAVDLTATKEVIEELEALKRQGITGDAIPKHLRDRMARLYDDKAISAVRIEINPFQGRPGECAFVAEPSPELLCILASLRSLKPRT